MKTYEMNASVLTPVRTHVSCADGVANVCKFDSREPDCNTFALVNGSDFHNGTIEVDVCGKLLPDAYPTDRGFIGIVFRSTGDGSEFESFYIRPTNGRECDDPVRKSHGCQYFSFPGYTFAYFRQFGIPGYEHAVEDIALGEWAHLKLTVTDDRLDVYVNGQFIFTAPPLKHGRDCRGAIGLYVDNGTDGYFKNLQVTYLD